MIVNCKIFFKLSILFFFSIPAVLWSQKKEVFASPEQLKQKIINIRYSKPEEALELSEALLAHGIQTKNKKIQCEAFHQTGKIYSIKGEHQNAIINYDRGIVIAKEIDYQEYLIELLVVKGNAYYDLNNDLEAFKIYTEASVLTEKYNYNVYKWIIATNLALLKLRSKNFREASSLFKRSLDYAQTYPNANKNIQANIVSNITMNIGESYLKQKRLDSATHYSKLGLQNSLTYEDHETSSKFFKLLGNIAHEKGAYEAAIDHLKDAEKKAQNLENKLILSEIYFALAASYTQQKNLNNAISFYTKSINLLDNKNDITPIYRDACLALAKIYSDKEDYLNSKTFYEKYVIANDTLQLRKNIILNTLYDDDVKTLEYKIKSLEERARTRKNYTMGFLIVLSLIIIFSIIYIKKIRLYIVSLSKSVKKKPNTTIDKEKVSHITHELAKLEEQHFFLQKDCNLYTIAKKLNTNTSYLSKIIGQTKNQSFSKYVNDLRITYAIQKIKDDKTFRSYSIKSIAEELGYKSADSFSKHFKQKTGQFPSAYIKNVQNQVRTDRNL